MLLHNRPVGLYVRGTQFYYRRRVPHDARDLIGRAEIWRSLRTDSLKIALRRLPSAMARVEAEIEHHRWVAGLPCDPTLLEPSSSDAMAKRPASSLPLPTEKVATPAAPPSPSLTLGEAYEQYLSDPTQAWSPRTREAYETSRRLAVSVIGEDVPMRTLARAHCRDYIDVLRFMPRNAAKRFPKLTARQAADRARNLVDCGLLAFVEEQRRNGRTKLFEEIDPGTKGVRAVAFSKWFTQFLRSCGAYVAGQEVLHFGTRGFASLETGLRGR